LWDNSGERWFGIVSSSSGEWWRLGDFSKWRWNDVDDVESLSDAEILITDEIDGPRSRGVGFAFEKTKGESARSAG
jgi:hypothetical protein